MPKLSVRKIATACEKPFPLSLKQGILSSGVGDRWIKRNEVKLFQFRIVQRGGALTICCGLS